jgi:hypothetical protein
MRAPHPAGGCIGLGANEQTNKYREVRFYDSC